MYVTTYPRSTSSQYYQPVTCTQDCIPSAGCSILPACNSGGTVDLIHPVYRGDFPPEELLPDITVRTAPIQVQHDTHLLAADITRTFLWVCTVRAACCCGSQRPGRGLLPSATTAPLRLLTFDKGEDDRRTHLTTLPHIIDV